MIHYKGKRSRPPVPDKYADERYAAARLELVESQQKVHELEELLAEEQSRPRLGCASCGHRGIVDWVDIQTGEVTRIVCPACAPLIDQFIEMYLGAFYIPHSVGI